MKEKERTECCELPTCKKHIAKLECDPPNDKIHRRANNKNGNPEVGGSSQPNASKN